MWSQDFKEFVGLLNAHHVEYLVVGGYAVGVHGHPRYTGDLEIWVRPTPENAQRVIATLREFGFGQLPVTESDLSSEGRVIQLGHPPFRIDLLTSAAGVRFEDCWRGRFTVDYEGVRTTFIGLEDLKLNKLAVARPKDLADLDELQRKP